MRHPVNNNKYEINKLFIVAPLETENFSNFVSSRNLELCKHRFNDYKVEFLMTNFSHREKKFNSKSDCFKFLNSQKLNINFKFFKSFGYKSNISFSRLFFNLLFSIQIFFYLLTKKKSTVLINSIPPELLFFVSLSSFFRGHKIILDVRDIWPDSLIRIGGIKYRFFKFYCDFYSFITPVRYITRVYYVSKLYLPWIDIRKLTFDPIFLPLGYDMQRWINSEFIPSQSIKRKDYVDILYIGYLNNQIDLDVLFNNVKIPFKLHIVGPDNTYKHKDIIYHGPKDYLNLPGYLSNLDFDFGLIPLSRYSTTAFPNKFFDYMAMNLPILYYNSFDLDDLTNQYSFIHKLSDLCSCSLDSIIISSHSGKVLMTSIKNDFSMQVLYSNEK